MALSTVVGLFNIVVGTMVTASILLMGGGLIYWYTYLGTYPTDRTKGITLMEWGVSILFVLVVLLGVAQYVQANTAFALMLVGAVAIAAVVYFIVTVVMVEDKKNKDEEH